MAWPCITRACCIARFWNQLDKADIAVPLVFTKYSEATEHPGAPPSHQQPAPAPPSARTVAIETQPAQGDGDAVARATGLAPGPSGEREAGASSGRSGPGPTSGSGSTSSAGPADSVMRQDYRAWKVQRPEPSCRPRSEYQPSDAPFERETQYQKDFRAWPLPRRGDHPWIPKPVQIATSSQAAVPALRAPQRRPQSQERWPVQAAEASEQEAAPGGAGVLAAGKASGADERDTRKKAGPAWMVRRAEVSQSQERWLLQAAEAPEQEAAPGGAGVLAAGKASGADERDTRKKPGPAWMVRRAEVPQSQEHWLGQAAEAPEQEAAPSGTGVLAAGKASGADERDTRKKPGPAWMVRRAEVSQSQERWLVQAPEAPEQEAAPSGTGVLAAGKASGADERDTRKKPGPAWMVRRAEVPQSQEHWLGQAAEAPEQEAAPSGTGVLAAGKASGADERDTRKKPGPAWMVRRAEALGQEQTPLPAAQDQVQATGPEAGRGRAAADALNRQIREEVASAVSSSYRNEFRAWTDIKPVKPIKAKPQYKPPDDKMAHETSYSAQFKGEANKPTPADNKVIDRRRIRSLYSEPFKEPPKVEKPSLQSSKPKKTSVSHKPPRKAKDKQGASGRASKKKSAEGARTAPPAADKEQSAEMNNKLAEAKESQVEPTRDSPKNQGPVATEPDKDQGPVGPGPLKDQGPGIQEPSKGQGPTAPEPLKDQAPVVPGPLKDLGPIVPASLKDQDHTVPEPLKKEGSVIPAPVKDQDSLDPMPLKNQIPMVPARIEDEGSVVPELLKDQGPTASAPVKDQGPMVPAPVKDQGPMVPAPVKDQGPMVPAPVKDQGPMVPAPVKDQGPMVPAPVKDQGPMVPAPVKDQGPMVPEPVDQGPMVQAPVKDQGPMVPEPVDQGPMVPAPVKDQGPMVPEPVDQGPIVPAPVKDQGPMVPEPVDQGPIVPAPVKDQGPMVPEQLKDTSARVIEPVKKEGSVLSESVEKQGLLVPQSVKDPGRGVSELLQDHDSVIAAPVKDQGPVVLEPVKSQVPIIPVPLKDQDPQVPPPAKDQGPMVPKPLKTQGLRSPQLPTVSPPPPVMIPTVPHAEYVDGSP
ncbi:microtubule-associated protein 6 isoform X2 [Odocoileus virginianus]|uniref:Microtubule-associated protein 6 isoform X2 n=1 Tax=Odocoileus virginianus TaxID=9874 RepID=A0ABM4IND8_ODOVR